MSGRINGIQAELRSRYSCAIYTHCMAHRTNLVVVDMCKNIKIGIFIELCHYYFPIKFIIKNIFNEFFSMRNTSLIFLNHYMSILHEHKLPNKKLK